MLRRDFRLSTDDIRRVSPLAVRCYQAYNEGIHLGQKDLEADLKKKKPG